MLEPHEYEDFVVGAVYETSAREVTDADIRAFADVSGDRNPLHLDEAYAAGSAFGGRVAHGVLGLAIATGLVHEMRLTAGTLIAFAGLDWSFRAPIRPGDAVRVRIEVAARRTTSKPDRGLVRLAVQLIGPDDRVVQEGEWGMLVRRRGAAGDGGDSRAAPSPAT